MKSKRVKNENTLSVAAVVVTYNRLNLLQESIAAIRLQSFPVSNIIVINNSSSDGTEEWLLKHPDITTVTQPNRGGAWGFYEGVKRAYHANADWIWIMDDDSIPEPEALQKLADAIEITKEQGDSFGFFGSKVIWKDGSTHLMNRQVKLQDFHGKGSKEYYATKNIEPVVFNSFVSFFVSREVVKKIGLPIKEFYIWADDVEYSMRVIKSGYYGAMVINSIVLHNTLENHTSNVYKDNEKSIWKHAYGLRNELYIRKHYKSASSYRRHIFKRFFIEPFKIFFKRKDHRWLFTKTMWKSAIEGLKFNPAIEQVDK